jgi:hypothetical protein
MLSVHDTMNEMRQPIAMNTTEELITCNVRCAIPVPKYIATLAGSGLLIRLRLQMSSRTDGLAMRTSATACSRWPDTLSCTAQARQVTVCTTKRTSVRPCGRGANARAVLGDLPCVCKNLDSLAVIATSTVLCAHESAFPPAVAPRFPPADAIAAVHALSAQKVTQSAVGPFPHNLQPQPPETSARENACLIDKHKPHHVDHHKRIQALVRADSSHGRKAPPRWLGRAQVRRHIGGQVRGGYSGHRPVGVSASARAVGGAPR